MGLFGSKKKSGQSDTSSIRKHNPEVSDSKSYSEASDIVGDSPSFSSLPKPRRVNSTISDIASIRSRPSGTMHKLFGSSTSKRRSSRGGSETSPKITQPNEYFTKNSTNRTSTSQQQQPADTPGSESEKTSGTPALGTLPSIGTPTESGTLMDAVNKDVPGASLTATTPSGGPRPSDLFAGKGVQWNQIDLTSRDLNNSAKPAPTEDLQQFLKARRQWIPTFKTEDAVQEESNGIGALDMLDFNAASGQKSAGLMSLKDLEESHKRKAALSSKLPIVSGSDGSVFAAAGSSSSARPGPSSPTGELPPPPTAPLRNQSFRTSTFTDGKRSNGNDSPKSTGSSLSRKPMPAADVDGGENGAAARAIPKRRSSMHRSRPTSSIGTPANGNSSGDPAAVAAAAGSAAAVANGSETSQNVTSAPHHPDVRPSIDTTTGFSTPEGGNTVDATPATPTNKTVSALAEPSTPSHTTPPRPPRSLSRQNSQDPVHAEETPAQNGGEEKSTLENVEEVASKAAPALQNSLPSTGATAPSS